MRDRQCSFRENNMDDIFPYVVPASYTTNFTQEQLALCTSLGHDAFVLPVREVGRLCTNIQPEEIPAGVSIEQLHQIAIGNLDRLAKAKAFSIALHSGPEGIPFIVWTGHWLAASCCILPGLVQLASRTLNSTNNCVSIPHRETMIIFPNSAPTHLKLMQDFIFENESMETKQITWGLFSLNEHGLVPIQ